LKIYIYGNQSFKKEIHETLEHSNIKFKLDNNTVIEEISSISKLKQIIKDNPNDIYLIDDEKIIKKNSLNKRIKFLTPKDGIEEEYLLDCGIADLSLNSLNELPKYIIRKYEELKALEPKVMEINDEDENSQNDIELDDELSMLLAKEEENKDATSTEDLDDIFNIDKGVNLDNIEDLIGNADIAVKNDSNDIMSFNDDFGLNNISFDYDDNDIVYKEESDELLEDENSSKVTDIFADLDFLGEEVVEEEEDITDLDKINNDLFGGFDFLNEEIQSGEKKVVEEDTENFEVIESDPFSSFDFLDEEKLESKKIDKSLQGDKMNDEFFELDSLSEKDLLEALSYKIEENSSISGNKPSVSEKRVETLDVNNSNVTDLSALISKLLNNKTLEITIKIKD
jgi:hypothetical protein